MDHALYDFMSIRIDIIALISIKWSFLFNVIILVAFPAAPGRKNKITGEEAFDWITD
jgi:hypothetical protein